MSKCDCVAESGRCWGSVAISGDLVVAPIMLHALSQSYGRPGDSSDNNVNTCKTVDLVMLENISHLAKGIIYLFEAEP